MTRSLSKPFRNLGFRRESKKPGLCAGFFVGEKMIIISGGQTGADIAGLKVAKQLNFKTGGFAAKNFMTENGPNPKLAEYNLIDEGLSYRERTELNCKIADFTLLFTFDSNSPGSKIVKQTTQNFKIVDLGKLLLLEQTRPKFCFDLELEFICENLPLANLGVLNVAGNRESYSPGNVERLTRIVLLTALNPLDGACTLRHNSFIGSTDASR